MQRWGEMGEGRSGSAGQVECWHPGAWLGAVQGRVGRSWEGRRAVLPVTLSLGLLGGQTPPAATGLAPHSEVQDTPLWSCWDCSTCLVTLTPGPGAPSQVGLLISTSTALPPPAGQNPETILSLKPISSTSEGSPKSFGGSITTGHPPASPMASAASKETWDAD